MKIFSYPSHPGLLKAKVVASFVGVPLSAHADTELPDDVRVQHVMSACDARDSRFPVLQCDDGSTLYMSNAIARHLSRVVDSDAARALRTGRGALAAAEIEQWMDFSLHEIDLAALSLLAYANGVLSADSSPVVADDAVKMARGALERALTTLNNHLAARTFLVGDRLSLADLIVAASLYELFAKAFDPTVRKRNVHVTRWFATVANQPAFVTAAGGKPTLANKPLTINSSSSSSSSSSASSGGAAAKAGGKAGEGEKKKGGGGGGGKGGGKKTAAPAAAPKQGGKGKNKEGMQAAKEDDFSSWYSQVITKSEMIEYYDVSGCYILRPWAFAIWEHVQSTFDGWIKESGVQNTYFPLLVSQRALETEKKHIEDFAPEVAWVTRSGDTDIEEPVAIRPTSETIMYPAYAQWIRSHRDLPLRLNQWCSIVRWEFKHPVPFLRSREFLWQEGHSAFATRDEAIKEVFEILDYYARVYEELYAVPVIKGRKSENEKFPGGDFTTTVEAFIPTNGRAIQAATSHHLGQNFSRMFNIRFQTDATDRSAKDSLHEFVYQNSWGLTTRSIGVMIMVHGDDKGLVLPPRVAPTQLVIIPLQFAKDSDETRAAVMKASNDVFATLKRAGVRVQLDDRTDRTPGQKFNYWDLKGVPLKIEVGPRDVEKRQLVIARRDTGAKSETPLDLDAESKTFIAAHVQSLLADVQAAMFIKAKAKFDEKTVRAHNWDEFMRALEGGNVCMVPWCNTVDSEERIKDRSKRESQARAVEAGFLLTGAAKSLCIPLTQPELPAGTKCFESGEEAKVWALFGRSY